MRVHAAWKVRAVRRDARDPYPSRRMIWLAGRTTHCQTMCHARLCYCILRRRWRFLCQMHTCSLFVNFCYIIGPTGSIMNKLMVCSLPSGQFVFSSRPVVKTVRYFRPLVWTSGQLGEYFVRRVRQFMRPSPSWRGEMYQKRFFNLLTRGQCMFMPGYFVSGPTEN